MMMTLASGITLTVMNRLAEIGLESLLERDPEFLIVSMMYLPTSPDQIIQSLKDGSLSSSASIVVGDQNMIGFGTVAIAVTKDTLASTDQSANLIALHHFTEASIIIK